MEASIWGESSDDPWYEMEMREWQLKQLNEQMNRQQAVLALRPMPRSQSCWWRWAAASGSYWRWAAAAAVGGGARRRPLSTSSRSASSSRGEEGLASRFSQGKICKSKKMLIIKSFKIWQTLWYLILNWKGRWNQQRDSETKVPKHRNWTTFCGVKSYMSPPRFSTKFAQILVIPSNFHQFWWHFCRKFCWITKIFTLFCE